MEVLLTLLVGLLVLGIVGFAGYAALGVGRAMVTDLLANRDPNPAWLEAVTPLKGRWLRLFLAAPGIAINVAFIFGVVVCYLGAALAAVCFVVGWIVWAAAR